MTQALGVSAGSIAASCAAPARCAHCGLFVPAGQLRTSELEQFCCAGCRSVRALICSAGFEQYYALRAGDEPKLPADTTNANYVEFSTPQFFRQHCEALGPDLMRVELYLERVHCAACLWLVERLPQMLNGVRSARLDLQRHVLEI